MDCSPPGSSDNGILQAGILEWVAIPFSRGSSQLLNLPNEIKPHPVSLTEAQPDNQVSPKTVKKKAEAPDILNYPWGEKSF